jgi:serine/threonine-protein kinase PknK
MCLDMSNQGDRVGQHPELLGSLLQHRYSLRRRLGEGGMGTTYLAHDLLWSRDVALKLLRDTTPELRLGLRTEFSILRGLVHPHLVQVSDFGVEPRGEREVMFYTAAYVEGTTLDTFARTRPWAEIVVPLAHALEGLRFLHRLGIRHGDVKPANVLVESRSRVRGVLIDLGCSQPLDAAAATAAGTPGFVAPEVLEGRSVDGRADLYAVGASLRRLAELCPSMPQRVRRLAERLSHDKAAKRPADVGEVLEALEARASETPIPCAQPETILGRAEETARFASLLDDLLAGKPSPRVIVWHGPPGAGLSRLLRELKWDASLRAAVVEGNATDPLAVTSMLRRAAGDPSLPEGLAGVTAALERLRRRDAAASAGLVILLDDAHDLLEPQRLLLRGLLRAIEPADRFALVCAQRSPPASTSPSVERRALGPLSEADVGSWVKGRLSAARIKDLFQLTGGFPASVQAVMSRVSAGHCTEVELRAAAGVASGSDRRLLGLGALEAPAQAALARIAAIDAPLDAATLELLGVTSGALGDLVRGGWLRLDEAGFVLARAGDGHAILASVSAEERRAAHREAAARLETSSKSFEASGREASSCVARRVRHLALAGDLDEARRSFASSRALAEAHPDGWLEAARALVAAAPAGSLDLSACEVFVRAGRPEEAISTLARELGARPPEPALVGISLCAGAATLKMGRPRLALRRLSRALASGDREVLARAHDLASRAHIQLGSYAAALEAARAGIAASSEERVLADLHDDVGVAASYLGDLALAGESLSSALRLHERGGRLREEARSESYRALMAFRAGDTAAAVRGYRRALALAERCDAPDLVTYAAQNLGSACHQLGELGRALGAYESGIVMAMAIGDVNAEITLRCNQAKLYADIGLLDRAEAAAARAEGDARAAGRRRLVGVARTVSGEAALHRGRAAEALRSFDEARLEFEREEAAREVAETDLDIARANLRLHRVQQAADACARAEAAADRLDARDLAARAHHARALLLAERGDAAGAAELLERALELANHASQRGMEALVHAALSSAYESSGAKRLARRHAESARELWERMASSLPEPMLDAFWAHPDRLPLIEPAVPETQGPSLRERKLARLLEINKKLNTSQEPSEVLRLAIDSALELTGAERGFVLVAGDGGSLRIAVARNIERSDAEELTFSRTIAERVVTTGQHVVTIDAEQDGRFDAGVSVHAMRLKSVLAAPICAASGVLGALYLDHRFKRGIFQGEEVELLTAFSDQVASALTNARLVEELRRRTEELDRERKRIEAMVHGQAEQIDRLTEEVRAKQAALERRHDFGAIVGKSAAMQRIFDVLDRVIDADISVLIQGESGTGKELVARAIHYGGPRKAKPFVAINCAAVPTQLLESELFGYARGAFTGADRDREGLFVQARGGTLFLDELGEMAPEMQVKLLRALQEREVKPLGANKVIQVDVRLVCATNRRLREEVAEGRFREDLFYRVGVVELVIPPLRERPEDTTELVHRLLADVQRRAQKKALRVSPAGMRALLQYPWPGNVRELENVITKAVLFADGDTLGPAELDLPAATTGRVALNRRQYERDEAARMATALRANRWNVSEAARSLGIPRSSFHRKMARYRLASAEAAEEPRAKRARKG